MSPDPLSDPLILAAPPSIDLPRLSDLLARSYGLDGVLEPLGGERDRNLRIVGADGTTHLVKLAHPAEDIRITNFQTAALLHLERTGPALPVPRVVRSRAGEVVLPFDCGAAGVSQLRVLSFLPGQPMAQVRLGRAQCNGLGGFVAELNQALATFADPADTRRLLWDIRELACFRRLSQMIEDAGQRRLVVEVLDRFASEVEPILPTLPAQVIHNDLNPHNVLVAPDRIAHFAGVIDFGDMLRAPRAQEVATACAYLVGSGDDALADPAAFISGYAARQLLSAAERLAIPVMMAMRMAITVAITSWRAQRQPENAAYIQRNAPRALTGLAVLAGLDQRATHRALQLEETSHV